MPLPSIIPLKAARALILHTQLLSTPQDQQNVPTSTDMLKVVEQLGCVQIDTLQKVARSAYFILWSRLGSYDRADFDRLAYEEPRQIFETWFHAACYIPLSEYRWRLPNMRRVLNGAANRPDSWMAAHRNSAEVDQVMEFMRTKGAVRLSDFPRTEKRANAWWDWGPAKAALEALFATGDVMVARRENNFTRVYDLTKRVLPAEVDRREPTWDEMVLHIMEQSVKAFGLCTPSQAADYTHEIKQVHARPAIEKLVKDGVLVPVQVETVSGKPQDMLIHRENIPNLQRTLDGDLSARRTTFLSPFDSFFYPHDRDEDLWDFLQVLECYKVPADRKWGYFTLPILHHDRLVGRFDPTLDRKSGVLTLHALYLEPGVAPDEELTRDVALAMKDFLLFHHAKDLVIEKSDPVDWGKQLLAEMG
jgi:uncharacterized protein YcaQ